MTSKRKSIVFFHPDLGIGGAERLVIDAAVGLKNLGHKVTIFTSHCGPTHCFDEARDGTLDVRVRGNQLFPATILGRFKILFTILRQIHLLVAINWSGELALLQPECFFVDQLAAGLPLMRWRWPDTRILFYCHFPDLLLVSGRKRWWKRAWRVGFDWLEGWGMRCADRVVVNSSFTKRVVGGVWEGLGEVGIVYPCVDTREKEEKGAEDVGGAEAKYLWEGKKVLLSINRFEKKKDIELAIRAFAELSEQDRDGLRLVIAGGYDPRVPENVSYHQHLLALSNTLGLPSTTAQNIVSALSIPSSISVLFLLSVPAQLKSLLLEAARLLIYTPSNEHFGIVPLEAMLAGVPVLAANSGGPLETVIEGETGWLRDVQDVAAWTQVMREVVMVKGDEELALMGERGKDRVRREFSASKMASRLDAEISALLQDGERKKVVEVPDVLLGIGAAGVAVVAVLVWVYRVLQ